MSQTDLTPPTSSETELERLRRAMEEVAQTLPPDDPNEPHWEQWKEWIILSPNDPLPPGVVMCIDDIPPYEVSAAANLPPSETELLRAMEEINQAIARSKASSTLNENPR
jgi:hypothetical protein